MTKFIAALAAALTLLLSSSPAAARPEGTFRICSQNLHRFGEERSGDSPAKKEKQKAFLVRRFENAQCDVVAGQEVIGKTAKQALRNLENLAGAWSRERGVPVQAVVGGSRDEFMRNGFLIPDSGTRIIDIKDYLDEPLPRLQPLGPIGRFLRAPFALVLELPNGKRLFVLNIHFKSKSRGFMDASGTDFETIRMQTAEAVRNIVRREERIQPQGTVFIVAGDRNCDLTSGAAAVLSGTRVLADFTGGSCRLNADEQPECGGSPPRAPALIGLFEHRRGRAPADFNEGSYRYRNKHELLDEILVRPVDLPLFTRPGGRIAIGFEGQFFKGSDHKLVWSELRW